MTYNASGYFSAPLNTPEELAKHCIDQPSGTLVARNALPPGLLIIKDFLQPSDMKKMLDYAAATPSVAATVHNPDANDNDPRTHESAIRVTDYIATNGLDAWLQPLLAEALNTTVAAHYKCQFEWYEKPSLLRYTSGGHYVPHADADNWNVTKRCWERAMDRDVSILLYLDDKYDGGELDFANFRFRLKPSPGMLICFPSDHRYVHCAHEVTRGVRHVLVSWAAKRDTPRVHAQHPKDAVLLTG